MLEQAFEKLTDGAGLILHSDQGWQYQHKTYRKMLEAKEVRISMSRKGNCLDKAVIESFFADGKGRANTVSATITAETEEEAHKLAGEWLDKHIDHLHGSRIVFVDDMGLEDDYPGMPSAQVSSP